MKIKKRFIEAIIEVCLLVSLCGCSPSESGEPDPDQYILSGSEKRFVEIADWGQTKLVYDKATGVEYVQTDVNAPYGSYVYTVLLKADGSPYLYQEEQ